MLRQTPRAANYHQSVSPNFFYYNRNHSEGEGRRTIDRHSPRRCLDFCAYDLVDVWTALAELHEGEAQQARIPCAVPPFLDIRLRARAIRVFDGRRDMNAYVQSQRLCVQPLERRAKDSCDRGDLV